jgi:hypothetical protein
MTTVTIGASKTKIRKLNGNGTATARERMEKLYCEVMEGIVSEESALYAVSKSRELSLEASKDAKYLLGISDGVCLAHIVAAYGSNKARDNLINHGDKVLLAVDSTKTPVENLIHVHGSDAQRKRIDNLRRERGLMQSFLRHELGAPAIIIGIGKAAFLNSYNANVLMLLSTNMFLYFYLQSRSKDARVSNMPTDRKALINNVVGNEAFWSSGAVVGNWIDL